MYKRQAVKDAGVTVKACSHITGGGFYENIPRLLIDGKRAVVEKNSYPVPPIFKMMAREGNVEEQMMYLSLIHILPNTCPAT